MKAKKFLMLLAAVLLSSVSAFAQSGGDEPLKGDVNGDGKVDVADIAAVIQIMKENGGTTDKTYYFSVGTTQVTSSNYTTANNATTTIPTTIEFSTTSRGYGYILAPSNKTISIVDADDNAPIPFTEQTSIIIDNHKVYKTNGALSVGGTIKITLS